MPHRELNNANAVKRMTETFGHSNNFATLSLRRSPIRETVTPIILRAGRLRQYTAFLASMQEKSDCFLSPSNNCGGGQTLGNKHLSLTNKFNF